MKVVNETFSQNDREDVAKASSLVRSLDNLFSSNKYSVVGSLPPLDDNPRILRYKQNLLRVQVDYSFHCTGSLLSIYVDVLENSVTSETRARFVDELKEALKD